MRRPLIPLAAAAAFSLALLFGLLPAAPAAAQSTRIQLSTDSEYVAADGGSARIVVTVSGNAVRSGAIQAGDRLTVSAERGVFGGETGPSRAAIMLSRAANALLEANVEIYGDGRVGPSRVSAAAAGASGSLRITFTGPPASIAAPSAPAADLPSANLLARDRHDFAFQVRDDLGSPLPGQPIEFEVVSGDIRIIRADRRSGRDGRAVVRVTGEAGSASVRASAAGLSAEYAFALAPAPAALLFVSLDPGPIQRGTTGEPGSVWLLLTDAAGRGVPGQRIEVNTGESGLALVSERPDGRLITDAQGSLFARFDAAAAAAGNYEVAAAWRGELEDRVTVRVAGRPASLYLAAERLAVPAPGAPDAYRITASLVDAASRPVADGLMVRWTLSESPSGATLEPPSSPVAAGAATVVLSLPPAADGPADVMISALVADQPRVGQSAMLSGLLGAGTTLRRGINRVTWVGAEAPVHQAMAPIARLAGEVWRWDGGDEAETGEEEGGWQRYRLGAGAEGSFALRPGDELYVRVGSAAVLPLVAR